MGPGSRRGPLEAGERVLVIDAKDRRYLLTLVPGASFHTHAGIVAHDEVIGRPEGSTVTGSTGRNFLVLRPTLADVVLKMPRGAQVIYPKDLGAILVAADLGPGQRVLEAGVGSGALSMAVLRAGAEVVGYEVREDFAARARANVEGVLGPAAAYRVQVRDVTEGIDETDLDRVLLDLPEPWRVVDHAAGALRAGGILLAYLPTINQTAQLRASLEAGPFGLAETVEILRRTWHIEARSVRPDHRMVAHTGFLTTARRLAGAPAAGPGGDQSRSMKMHSPGHSSDASTTASSRSSGTSAIPADPPGSFFTSSPSFT
ncbi:MAG TPA: tRNA (adenine-N1)-methyltransferase [Acidimicrobiales bacterium]|nr:tRNA (adenine-N1)-methyltransferase [Acidimicrobiales bacterium]